jgi:hypothetical protein
LLKPNIGGMKKLLFTILLATGLSGAVLACGSDKEEKENKKAARAKQIDIYVGAALAAAYGEPSQEQGRLTAITRQYRQAAFIHRSLPRSLFFSPDNTRRLARVDLVAPSELSGKMTRKLARKYKGYQIARVIKYHDGETMYFVSLKKDQEEVLVFMPLGI